jgi:hypothetical protein
MLCKENWIKNESKSDCQFINLKLLVHSIAEDGEEITENDKEETFRNEKSEALSHIVE